MLSKNTERKRDDGRKERERERYREGMREREIKRGKREGKKHKRKRGGEGKQPKLVYIFAESFAALPLT